MKIGYISAITQEGSVAVQRMAFAAEGVDQVAQERRSQSPESRPALRDAVSALKAGDTLVAWKLDSLGSSLSDIVTVLFQLSERQISFLAVSGGTEIVPGEDAAVTNLIAALYRAGRSQIVESGIEVPKPRGRIRGTRIGRRLLLSRTDAAAALELVEKGASATVVAKAFKVGRSTLYRAMRGVQETFE